MYETIRIVGKLRPKYVIWENVKNLLSKKHKHNFDAYIETMNILGYNSYYQVLNAKDYGIPQNRERVFTISIRKYIDNGYKFPKKQELKLRLKDMLEDEVDKKYYLSDMQVNKIKTSNFMQEEKILVRNATKKGYLEAAEGDGIDISSRMQYHRGNVQKGMIQTLDCQGGNSKGVVVEGIKVIGNYMPSVHDASRIVDSDGLAPTVKENHGTVTATNYGLRIRKLTPKECWRLMSFDDEDFEKAEKVNSNTQLYKQARKLNRRQCIRKNIRKFIKYGGVI